VSFESEPSTENHLLTGSLRKTVFFLALPVLAEQFLSFCVGFYDTYLSGRISSEATSAIGLAAYVGWFAALIFGLIGSGTTALISRAYGSGDSEQVNRVMNQSLFMAVILGMIVGGSLYFLAPVFAGALSLSGTTRMMAIYYLQIDGLGHFFTSIGIAGSASMRGTGNMRTPLLVFSVISLVNVIASTLLVWGTGSFEYLDWLPISISPMGVNGIVWGTVTAKAIGAILIVYFLVRGNSGMKINRHVILIHRETIRRILKIGIPAAIDGIVMWIGQFLFLMVISRLATGAIGTANFAAHIIGMRVEAITYLIAYAWGAAAATMVGQSLGAENQARARKVGNEAALQSGLWGVLISIVFLFGAKEIYHFMHDDILVHQVGIFPFQILALVQIPLVLSIVYHCALRGAGDTRVPMIITIIGVFGFRVPFAWLFGIYFEGGLLGAWIGMYADMIIRGVLLAARYLSGKWTDLDI
jgi:MATE family, multidrug efflux pump